MTKSPGFKELGWLEITWDQPGVLASTLWTSVHSQTSLPRDNPTHNMPHLPGGWAAAVCSKGYEDGDTSIYYGKINKNGEAINFQMPEKIRLGIGQFTN